MANIKSFRALRPKQNMAEIISELPYDVISSNEAKEAGSGNKYSFFHITRAEIDLPEGTNPYDKKVYEKGRDNLLTFIDEGVLQQDEKACLYLYTLELKGKSQTGLVACVNINDYKNNIIKKHELTREEKENDRTVHLDTINANTGPVFLLYKEDGSKEKLFSEALKIKAEFDFTTDDGVRHILRVIEDKSLITSFTESFKNDNLYVADGHHRAASAFRVGEQRKEQSDGSEEFNWFLTVIFPHDQLNILPYNRVIKDIGSMTKDDFFREISKNFSIEKTSERSPQTIHSISMYIENEWYLLKPQFVVDEDDPFNSLDVKILQDKILVPLLGIKDPRTDNRINFIGGIRGVEELERVVDSGEYKLAFSMYPTTVEQLISVSDMDGIMPPKSTWFEPKLRSGLVIHLL